MANVFFTNQALQAASHSFSAVWKLTRAIKKAGWDYRASGDGTSKDTTGTDTSDLWGGAADPATDTYPTALDSVTAWWMARGPSTLKFGISSGSGNPVRGEKVTQATSGAEGELLGVMNDTVTPSNNFIVILPRTGTFDGTNLITGATSGFSFTPSATPTEYFVEVVFWKSTNTTTGTAYYSRASGAETTLDSLKTATGCTATVAPGGGGTGNTFPATSYAARGTGGSAAHANWLHTATLGSPVFQAVATNAIGATNVSPDGSFYLMCGTPGVGATDNTGFILTRVDDTEDGDVDPFVWWYPSSSVSRTASTGDPAVNAWSSSTSVYNSTNGSYHGWRKRSFASGDAWSQFWPAALSGVAVTGTVMLNTFATPERVASHTQTVTVREAVWAVTMGTASKQRKGTLRWLYFVPTGSGYDSWDTKTWVQTYTPTSSFLGLVVGPYDGTTTPSQT